MTMTRCDGLENGRESASEAFSLGIECAYGQRTVKESQRSTNASESWNVRLSSAKVPFRVEVSQRSEIPAL
jgi:hypothetical protein